VIDGDGAAQWQPIYVMGARDFIDVVEGRADRRAPVFYGKA